MAEEKYIVHTTAPINPETGKQNCVRCGELLHEVDLGAIPKPGPIKTELSKIEAHCYAPAIHVMVVPGYPKRVLGDDNADFKLPSIGQFCVKAGKKAE